MVGSKPIDELSVYFSSGTEKTMWAELLRQTCDKKSLSSDLGCSELPLLTPTTPKRMPDIVETRTLTVAPHEHIGLNRTCLRLIDSIVAALQNPVLNLATFGTSLDMVLAFDFVVTGQPVLIPRLVQNTVIHILTYGTCTFSSFLTACGFDSHMAGVRVRRLVQHWRRKAFSEWPVYEIEWWSSSNKSTRRAPSPSREMRIQPTSLGC